MSRAAVSRRGHALVSFTAVLGLGLAAAAVSPGPAQSAAPTGDCAVAFPVGDLQRGDDVTALSVTSGTTPQPFAGEVLGVLDDGIAPGVDMVMVEITPPASPDWPEPVNGIWHGMSGSPVYVGDRVVGAISYGLSWGPSWVAGVTPFADMDDYLAAPAAIEVGDATARMLARRTDVTQAAAVQGFSQLHLPVGVSGVGSRRLTQAEQSAEQSGRHAWLPRRSYAMGSAAAAGDGPGPETVVAGGNLAASLSYGDVTQAGVGTATSVCDDRVVGFGHPMTFRGSTSLTLHPAEALYIQGESLGAPFKVANLGAPAGTITDDHLTGITGLLGAPPETAAVTSTVSYLDRQRTGSSQVSVDEATAATTFYQLVGNHDRVLDAFVPGSELMSWTIDGHEEDGSTFSLDMTDRYASDYDITSEVAWDVADLAWSLSSLRGVTIDGVSVTSEVSEDSSTWKVARLEQRVGGAWTKAGRGAPVIARAGAPLRLRAVLTGAQGTRTVPISMTAPAAALGQMGRLTVTGGVEQWSNVSRARSVRQAERLAATMVRNDQLVVDLEFYSHRGRLVRSTVSEPLDKVVEGGRRVRVLVTR